ncbi:hypothetical protein WDW86_03840 [Bdellovibrionota bacterium FG-2]
MSKFTILLGTILVLAGLSINSCGLLNRSTTVTSSTQLTSKTLSASAITHKETMYASASTCASGKTCITPTAVTGKVHYAGIIVGAGTENGTSLGPILGKDERPDQGTAYADADLEDFDFSKGIKSTAATASAGGGPEGYPADDKATAGNINLYFGYMDFSFSVDSGTLSGAHTIRLIMADITGTEYKRGDLLHKGASEASFFWCTTAAGCTHTTRPTTPLTYSAVANFTNTNGRGNMTIPAFFVNLSNATPVLLKKTELATGNWLFKVDFSITNGLVFSSDPTSLTTVPSLISAFSIPQDPGSESTGFTAELSVTKE